ncbi:MAG: 16S rRNA (adenine(1518)-N(6)/adenine(1519)-N(6))-dimethyltransferase RsmA [Thermoanaerobaculia bacterium]|nr:16S rRNA (adenine(1518)-N(6)/adenine(1519)-N(6))-dimethyltransferase RsmA [Thermoanaerobaculia bacterium]
MLKPKKKWGQNFLRNPRAARDIAAALEPAADELVLEIGPGDGALTRELLGLGRPVRAIEIDPELAERLRTAFPGTLEVIEGDATDAPLPDVPFRVAGNLPYNVATPIVRRLITHPLCRRGVFMLQKEVVDKILAKPSDEEYGYLSLFVKIWADSRLLFTLPPNSFFPRPKVWSAVVVLNPVERGLANPKEYVVALVSHSFRMRRKTLANNLTGFRDLGKAEAEETIAAAGLDPRVRAEALSLAQFDELATAVSRREAKGERR